MKKTRHRISGIALDPLRSSHDIGIEILVDGNRVHKLESIKAGQDLSWCGLCLPCDVHETSTIAIRITEIHTFRDQSESHVYPASCFGEQDTWSIDRGSGKYSVNLEGMSKNGANKAYYQALTKAQEIKSQPSIVGGLGKAGVVFKGLLQLGTALADMDPTGSAKVACGLCAMAWERLDQQQNVEADLTEFIGDLSEMVPSIENVKPLARKDLAETVQDSVWLIEDVSLFVLNYKSRSMLAQLKYFFVDSGPQEQMETLRNRFRRLRREFDTRVGVQNLATGTAVETEVMLAAIRSKLQPANQAGYDPSRACMGGTRLAIIRDMTAWIQDSNKNQRFAWIYGLAGLGKSSVAASICQKLDEQGALAASFFCKRDSPELREPCRLITTIAYILAARWKAYGKAVSEVLQADPELHNRHIQPLYDALLAKPLRALVDEEQTLDRYVIVIDALDECGTTDGRRQLIACLRDLSRIGASWKVVVTSRPDADIQECFAEDKAGWFTPYNLLNYDASADITTFIQHELSHLEQLAGWPNDAVTQLSDRSSGLFIWARTSCKHIKDGYDPLKRITQILAGKRGQDAVAQLDTLYTTAITTGALDGEEDNLEAILQFLGVIAATATRTPLPLSSLCRLLSKRIDPSTLERMVHNMLSVLYMDPTRDFAVRVSHPSFMDFITKKSRSGELCVNLDEQNGMLAECCIEVMLAELKFNMCGIPTSDVLNKDMEDLKDRVKARFDSCLRYCCVYWTSHVVNSSNPDLHKTLQGFLHSCEMMYWIESLSLLGELAIAVRSMQDLSVYQSVSDEIRAYARDVYRFVLYFYDAISASTPHLYLSALPLAPQKSLLAQRMRPHFPNTLAITQGADEDWTSCIRTIPVGSIVFFFAWSPVSHRIATGWRDRVRLWDEETGAALLETTRVQSENGVIYSLAFSPDGRYVASGCSDSRVYVWDAETGEAALEPLCGHSSAVCSVVFSPDGKRLASGSSDKTVRVWDAKKGAMIHTVSEHEGGVNSVAYSPSGSRLASASGDGYVRVWDVQTYSMVHKFGGDKSGAACVAFSSDSHKLASGWRGGTIRVWDVSSGDVLWVIRGDPRIVLSVTFSPDDYVISGSMDGTVRTWDAQTGKQVGILVGHSQPVTCVACSPDGRRIMSSSGDSIIRIWDTEAIDPTAEAPQEHPGFVTCVTPTPDGRHIVACSSDGMCKWDATTGARLGPATGRSGLALAVAYLPDGRCVASSSEPSDHKVHVWNAHTGQALFNPLQGHSNRVRSVSFSPDGRMIATASLDQTIRLWDASSGVGLFETLHAHTSGVNSIAFSPDSRRLVSGSEDCTVRVWDATTGGTVFDPLLGHSKQVRFVAYSPDGVYIASGSTDGTIRLWNATTGEPVLELLQGQPNRVRCLDFSHDSQLLLSFSPTFLTFSPNGTIRVWDMKTGTLYCDLIQHNTALFDPAALFDPDFLRAAKFFPNSHRILSSSNDSSVCVWDLATCAEADSPTRRLLPETNIPLTSGCAQSQLISTSSLLARHADERGWVLNSDDGIYVWLPPDLRHTDDSSIRISERRIRSRAIIDFARFVHGRQWTSVARS